MQHFSHEEGRILKTDNTFRYEYNITDHLGNVRLSFADIDESGDIDEATEVIQEDHYYPFGLRLGGLSNTSGVPNRYRYNGKELQDELGLGWYDYGARMYDPAVGRWNGVDPLAESFQFWSPYTYSFDNPIRFIDPDGAAPDDIVLIGDNNSSVTIKTDLIDIEVNASSIIGDVGGNHVIEGDDVVEAGLDIVGTVDPTPITDGVATAYYASKGEVGNALISAAGVIPYVGDVGKLLRAGKHTKTLKKAIDCLTCFTGSTLVLTENGPKEIKDVEVGEMVWAYDEETGNVALKKVLITHSITKDSIFEIHLNTGEFIEATPNHPFFVHGTWFHVRDLEEGDTLKTYTEDDGVIVIDSLILRRGEFKVYNFTVEDYHTYYVGQDEILVHNCGGKKAPKHHIATNKNKKSTARGGPWTPRFKKILDKAGIDIDKGAENIVPVPGHKGPHPEAYHKYVHRELLGATEGLKGGSKAYKNAVSNALARIKKEATTSGSQVNKWLTKQ